MTAALASSDDYPDRECPLCGADTQVDGDDDDKYSTPIRRCTSDDDCNWCVAISGGYTFR